MKLSLPALFILGVFAFGCGSASSRGTTGGGGQAGFPMNTGSGGSASGGMSGSPGTAGSGGAAPSPGSGGVGGIGANASGGSHASGGVPGGQGGMMTGGAGGAGRCPAGQHWCPGCGAGGGICSAVGCPAAQCPVQDAGMPDGPGDCSAATTDSECAARAGCHAVFVDDQNCACAALGCCARFSRCADGPATCTSTGISCTLQTPHCEGAYVVSYAGGCYDGCVRSTDCPAGTGGAGGSAAGGQGGGAGGQGGGAAMLCSSAPPIACPTGLICDYDTPNRCGAGYVAGHCVVLPDGCTADYTPVCGCDNKTYSNDCARRQARQQLAHTGACT